MLSTPGTLIIDDGSADPFSQNLRHSMAEMDVGEPTLVALHTFLGESERVLDGHSHVILAPGAHNNAPTFRDVDAAVRELLRGRQEVLQGVLAIGAGANAVHHYFGGEFAHVQPHAGKRTQTTHACPGASGVFQAQGGGPVMDYNVYLPKASSFPVDHLQIVSTGDVPTQAGGEQSCVFAFQRKPDSAGVPLYGMLYRPDTCLSPNAGVVRAFLNSRREYARCTASAAAHAPGQAVAAAM